MAEYLENSKLNKKVVIVRKNTCQKYLENLRIKKPEAETIKFSGITYGKPKKDTQFTTTSSKCKSFYAYTF